jgi:hypothetical protein
MLDTLDTRAGVSILRVRAVAENGVLELEGSDAGRCGYTWSGVHHVIVLTLTGGGTRGRRFPPPDFACTRCRKASGAARMLLCDSCGVGWHLECLARPLSAVPAGDWFCDECVAAQAPLMGGSAAI